jgi:hypothetical protein
MFQDMQHLMKSGVGDTPDRQHGGGGGGHATDKDRYRHVDLQEFQNMRHLAQSGGGGGGGFARPEKRDDVFSEFDLFEVVLSCSLFVYMRQGPPLPLLSGHSWKASGSRINTGISCSLSLCAQLCAHGGLGWTCDYPVSCCGVDG